MCYSHRHGASDDRRDLELDDPPHSGHGGGERRDRPLAEGWPKPSRLGSGAVLENNGGRILLIGL